MVLDRLSNPSKLHIAEEKLLSGFLRSVPRIENQTPTEFVAGAEKSEIEEQKQDLEPYHKAHIENMPHTNLLNKSGVAGLIRDGEEKAINNK